MTYFYKSMEEVLYSRGLNEDLVDMIMTEVMLKKISSPPSNKLLMRELLMAQNYSYYLTSGVEEWNEDYAENSSLIRLLEPTWRDGYFNKELKNFYRWIFWVHHRQSIWHYHGFKFVADDIWEVLGTISKKYGRLPDKCFSREFFPLEEPYKLYGVLIN